MKNIHLIYKTLYITFLLTGYSLSKDMERPSVFSLKEEIEEIAAHTAKTTETDTKAVKIGGGSITEVLIERVVDRALNKIVDAVVDNSPAIWEHVSSNSVIALIAIVEKWIGLKLVQTTRME